MPSPPPPPPQENSETNFLNTMDIFFHLAPKIPDIGLE